MPERAKAEQVLDVIPRDPAEGILAEESGDDDAHAEASRR